MHSIATSSRYLTRTLRGFEYQALLVYRGVVQPRWNQPPWRNRLPDVLHALMMWCFARIDLLSSYWGGDSSPRGQSKRMVDFIEHYMGCSRQAASMAVKMWRHNLMHTGEPRMLHDPEQGTSLSWLLHWGKQLPKAEHFTVTGKTAIQINMALFHLIEDLKRGQRNYLKDLAASTELQVNFHKAHRQITETKLKVY